MVNACGMPCAVRGDTPLRERGYNFTDGAHAPYRTNDCLYHHAIRRKQKLKPRMIRSVKHACKPNPRAWANSRDSKNALSRLFPIVKSMAGNLVTESDILGATNGVGNFWNRKGEHHRWINLWKMFGGYSSILVAADRFLLQFAVWLLVLCLQVFERTGNIELSHSRMSVRIKEPQKILKYSTTILCMLYTCGVVA
jgi:hypothetical protein